MGKHSKHSKGEEPGFSVRNLLLPDDSYPLIYRGFRTTFANGYTVSVQFGTVNYCSVYNADIPSEIGRAHV